MSMFDVSRVSVEIGGEEISLETGKLARQAGGAVVVRSGDTMVLSTATIGNLRDVDFLPLTVDVEERHYAAGKIPGSFFRREGRAGEKAILTARMIDRPLRPLFPKGWHYDTQIVCQPMSVDYEHPYDILAMNGASAAVAVSPIPVPTHVGAVRIGKLHGDFVVNPAEESAEELEMDLVVAGFQRRDPDGGVWGNGVTEAEVLDALDIAHEEIKKICAAIEELRARRARRSSRQRSRRSTPPWSSRSAPRTARSSTRRPRSPRSSPARRPPRRVEEEVLEQYASGSGDDDARPERRAEVSRAFDQLEKEIIRRRIAVDKKRPDGRAEDEIRPIECEVDVSPRVHGSASVHPRGDPDPLQRGPGHEPHGHAGRQPQPGRVEDLLAPLQLPAVLGRGGRLHARPEAPRHRPRRARRARAGADDPEPGGLPLCDQGRLGDAGVQRVLLDGLGLRLVDGADGGRRAGVSGRSPAWRWG